MVEPELFWKQIYSTEENTSDIAGLFGSSRSNLAPPQWFSTPIAEMSGLKNFSVRVQSWFDKIKSDPVMIHKILENNQSDPVLVRQYKIMYFYFASWGKIAQ